MASGFGFNGGRNRCFNLWQEFSKCYVMSDKPEECILQQEDYLECLHHTKEIARAKVIVAEARRQRLREQHAQSTKSSGDNVADNKVIRLNIVEKEEEAKA
ncbi:hypothetical protein K493DRAFT_352237 [Basidiobolus meristosporus CBS 931.73]|uniref:NADH dehydrogenase [ubiquinone] iron-sulfur protein 5 n=1 Tax=Basidiobolus meristosporus CBS 931.73 TaxID=1314790 RepID=A0A1Y1Y9T2_9FUNG|nr:hypothetical protein K493DRAFT_352237 [Basidiobolus meristosporus CBS 931.73]|eukprot:ORX94780.1 hypothetical protein K493DRAFT_352237 [Basidiobolus meristosporus CBS 931.73]